MLLEAKNVKVESSGMKDTTTFRANLDGMMFDNLINGIYSNKIGAGLREYTTNARDGHARKGNLSEPFEVGLPTTDKAFFEVRDFGCSLSHDDVFNIFAVLGESTKRDTNNETGCLGLGSKSAFAYTNIFSVTCWKDGKKRDYSCYIGNNGQPMVSLITEVPSAGREGVRISYAVKTEDIEAFNREASQQLRGFDPQPKITRSSPSYKPLNDENLVLSGDTWKLYTSIDAKRSAYYGAGKPFAIQGSVAYPININNQTLQTFMSNSSVNRKIKALLSNTDTLIRFPIGDLTMTTSREELAYNDITCKNIVKQCEVVVSEIEDKLDEEYAKFKTMKEARLFRSKAQASGLTNIETNLGLTARKWNDQEIKENILFGEENGKVGEFVNQNYIHNSYYTNNVTNGLVTGSTVLGELRYIKEGDYRNKFGEIKSQFKFPSMDSKNSEFKHKSMVHKVNDIQILIDIESEYGDKNKNALMRDYWKNKVVSNGSYSSGFLWIKLHNMSDADKFLDTIFHTDKTKVVYLHKCSELKMPKKGSSTSTLAANGSDEKKLRTLSGARYSYSYDPNTYEIVDFKSNDFTKDNKKLPVIFFNNNKFYLNEKDMNDLLDPFIQQDMESFIYSWVGGGKELYVINGSTIKFYKDNPLYFKDGVEWMKEEWMASNKDWKKKYVESTWREDDSEELKYAKKFLRLQIQYNVSFKDLKQRLVKDKEKISKGSSNSYSSEYNLPKRYDKILDKEIDQAVKMYPKPVADSIYLGMVQKDPVLKYLIDQISLYIDDELISAIKHHAVDKQYT